MNLDDYFPYRLTIVAEAVSSAIASIYRQQYGLTRQEWRIISVLGDRQAVIASDLRGMTTLSKSDISRALRSLESRELVTRQPAENDHRDLEVRLSDNGQRVYRELLPVAVERANALLQDFTSEELKILPILLGKLQKSALPHPENPLK